MPQKFGLDFTPYTPEPSIDFTPYTPEPNVWEGSTSLNFSDYSLGNQAPNNSINFMDYLTPEDTKYTGILSPPTPPPPKPPETEWDYLKDYLWTNPIIPSSPFGGPNISPAQLGEFIPKLGRFTGEALSGFAQQMANPAAAAGQQAQGITNDLSAALIPGITSPNATDKLNAYNPSLPIGQKLSLIAAQHLGGFDTTAIGEDIQNKQWGGLAADIAGPSALWYGMHKMGALSEGGIPGEAPPLPPEAVPFGPPEAQRMLPGMPEGTRGGLGILQTQRPTPFVAENPATPPGQAGLNFETPFANMPETQPDLTGLGYRRGYRGRFTTQPEAFAPPGKEQQYSLPFQPDIPYEGVPRETPFQVKLPVSEATIADMRAALRSNSALLERWKLTPEIVDNLTDSEVQGILLSPPPAAAPKPVTPASDISGEEAIGGPAPEPVKGTSPIAVPKPAQSRWAGIKDITSVATEQANSIVKSTGKTVKEGLIARGFTHLGEENGFEIFRNPPEKGAKADIIGDTSGGISHIDIIKGIVQKLNEIFPTTDPVLLDLAERGRNATTIQEVNTLKEQMRARIDELRSSRNERLANAAKELFNRFFPTEVGGEKGRVAPFESRSNDEILIHRTTDPKELRNLFNHWLVKRHLAQAANDAEAAQHASDMINLVINKLPTTGNLPPEVPPPPPESSIPSEAELRRQRNWEREKQLGPQASGPRGAADVRLDRNQLQLPGQQPLSLMGQVHTQEQLRKIGNMGLSGQEFDLTPEPRPLPPGEPTQAELPLQGRYTRPDMIQKKFNYEKIQLTQQNIANLKKTLADRSYASRPPSKNRTSWDEMADRELDSKPVGRPGLEVKDTYGGGADLIYRNPNGRAVVSADIVTTPEGPAVSFFMAKRFMGGIGRAVQTVLTKAIEMGADKASGLISENTYNIIKKLIEDAEGSMPLEKFDKYVAHALDWVSHHVEEIIHGVPGVENIPDSNLGKMGELVHQMFKDETGARMPPTWKAFKEKSGVGMGSSVPSTAEGIDKLKGQKAYIDQVLTLSKNADTVGDVSGVRQVFPLWYTALTKSGEFRKGLWPMISGGWSNKLFNDINAKLMELPVMKREPDPNSPGDFLPSYADKAGWTLRDMVNNRGELVAAKWLEDGRFFGIPDNPISRLYSKTLGEFVAAKANRAFTMIRNHVGTNRIQFLFDLERDLSNTALATGKARPNIFNIKYEPMEAVELNPYRNIVRAREIVDSVKTLVGDAPLKTYLLPHRAFEINLESSVKVLTRGLFAPRNVAKQVRMMNPSTYIMASPFVRRQYMQGMLASMAGWAAITKMAQVAGDAFGVPVKVNWNDPTDADFGKAKIGNYRMDFGQGFIPYAVLAGRLWNGKYRSSTTHETHTFGEAYRGQTAWNAIEQFGSNKLDPLAKFAYDLLNASQHQPFHVADRITQLYMPLAMSDLYQLYQEKPYLLPFMTIPILAGAGSQTYSRGNEFAGTVQPKFIDPRNDIVLRGFGIKPVAEKIGGAITPQDRFDPREGQGINIQPDLISQNFRDLYAATHDTPEGQMPDTGRPAIFQKDPIVVARPEKAREIYQTIQRVAPQFMSKVKLVNVGMPTTSVMAGMMDAGFYPDTVPAIWGGTDYPGRTEIYIAEDTPSTVKTLIHEMMHVAGAEHGYVWPAMRKGFK